MYKKLPILIFVALISISTTKVKAAPTINNISDNKSSYSNSNIPKYKKLEIKFDIANTNAKNFFLPYDANMPSGLENNQGITVDAVFSQDNFSTSFKSPAFYQREYINRDSSGNLVIKNGKVWSIPTGKNIWTVRFSPNKTGSWQYKITATDSSGTTTSSTYSFNVTDSSIKGFLKVSSKDTRYFEFDNGDPFLYNGIASEANMDNFTTEYKSYSNNGINFIREWWSGTYGTSWGEWTQGNAYAGYLPRTMLYPITNPADNKAIMTTRLDYNSENTPSTTDDGNDGWFDACLVGYPTNIALNQNKTYRMQVTYLTKQNLAGPRVAGKPFGIVGKLDNGGNSWGCWDSGTGSVVTNYGESSNTFTTISGTFNSGSNSFMPRLLVGLENVNSGEAEIYSISVKEDLGNGQYGPELLGQYSSDMYLYVNDVRANENDIKLEEMEKNGIYVKAVLLEKEDKMWKKINNNGTLTVNMDDNGGGFYGSGRSVNMTRFLQAAWFRYAQARWGYSTNVHSFELLNEGDPSNASHLALSDEMGKYLRCRAFGISVPFSDASKCNYSHPNSHMSTTSFWYGFLGSYWNDPNYPNNSYADLHAYISTSTLPSNECDKATEEKDAAYYHLCHSKNLVGWNIGKPIVRGEAGMDVASQQCDTCLGITNDTTGVWLQTYLWSTLDNGALYELYWWYGSHIKTGSYDISSKYKNVVNFTNGLLLNNGNYKDLAATVSNSQIQVIGQKDTVNQNAHFWARHTGYTWKNVVDNVSRTAQSGTVTITGFTPNKSFKLEEWNTQTGAVKTSSTTTSNASGAVIISISSLTNDTAFKIINTTAVTPQPSPTMQSSPTPNPSINTKMDVNKDGAVNLLDVIAVLGEIFK